MQQLQANKLYAAAILSGQSSCSYYLALVRGLMICRIEQQSHLDLNNTWHTSPVLIQNYWRHDSIYQITKGFPYKEKIFAWV